MRARLGGAERERGTFANLVRSWHLTPVRNRCLFRPPSRAAMPSSRPIDEACTPGPKVLQTEATDGRVPARAREVADGAEQDVVSIAPDPFTLEPYEIARLTSYGPRSEGSCLVLPDSVPRSTSDRVVATRGCRVRHPRGIYIKDRTGDAKPFAPKRGVRMNCSLRSWVVRIAGRVANRGPR